METMDGPEAGDMPPPPPSPDVMNDPAFNPPPPQRRDTLSSNGGGDTCRICRSEATPDEPLFYPCKCSGSIKFVHQECLMEWLSHSHKKHCELCKTPFRFTKLYDANMPTALPWTVFVGTACVHTALMVLRICRALLVSGVWLVALPWGIRWTWRWMFWAADAGWAREAYVQNMKDSILGDQTQIGAGQLVQNASSLIPDALASTFEAVFGSWRQGGTRTTPQINTLGMISEAITSALKNGTSMANTFNAYNTTKHWPQADPSILSSWSYIAELTPNPTANRFILDIFEGQLITCVVITGFILIFLIREWVVQQQPLVNLDNLNNAERDLNRQQVRLQRQAELLDHARQRLENLQNDVQARAYVHEDTDSPDFAGWDKVYDLIDAATNELAGNSEGRDRFTAQASAVIKQIMAAERSGIHADELSEGIFNKLKELPEDHREEWGEVLVNELKRIDALQRRHSSPTLGAGDADTARDATTARRPPMPNRDTISRAAQIQRFLEETDARLIANNTTTRNTAPGLSSDGESVASQLSSSDGSWVAVSPPNSSISPLPPQAPPMEHTDIFQDDENDMMPITNAGPDAKINIKRKGKGKAIVPEPKEGLDGERSPLVMSLRGRKREEGVDRNNNVVHVDDNDPQRLSAAMVQESNDNSAIFDTATAPLLETTNDDDNDDVLGLIDSEGERLVTIPGHELNNNSFSYDVSGSPDTRDNDPHIHRSVVHNDQTSNLIGADAEGIVQTSADHPSARAVVARRSHSESDAETGEHRQQEIERIELLNQELGFDQLDEVVHQNIQLGTEEMYQDSETEAPTQVQPANAPSPSLYNRMLDWFWGDIQVSGAQEPVPIPGEERLEHGNEVAPAHAPFVPVRDEQDVANVNADEIGEHDPEVVAAAQQAGLDAEAIEDAEDLEGIFELIGFQGPLIGLFQTSCFCIVLVIATVAGAVVFPYVWGKFVLSFLSAPLTFLVKTPLQVISFLADILVDTALLIVGWGVVSFCFLFDMLGTSLKAYMPRVTDYSFSNAIGAMASSTADNAGHRLQSLFLSGHQPLEDFGWNAAFLSASVHAHASLKTIEQEIDSVLSFIGNRITYVVETISTDSTFFLRQWSVDGMSNMKEIPLKLVLMYQTLREYTQPLVAAVWGLRTGSLTFQTSATTVDPSLVYWSSNDRGLAVLTGYIALAVLAAIYVAVDTPVTSSPTWQKNEKLVRDTLRQAGGVLKVILIISIEMLVFPLYCGLLLDIAFLPLFESASVATRWAFANSSPYTFCFVHWFVGTCYMFHFALFVGMCRKILRRGVLWFIRDPDDPTFHPVRDVLERNVTTQLRKIAFSALVYGALVILCLGGVIWGIGKIFKGIFPLQWVPPEPYLEFPLDWMLFSFLTPALLMQLKFSSILNTMYAWWLRKCAKALRLSHFLFDDRRKEEEGCHVRKTWSSFFLQAKADPNMDNLISQDGEAPPAVYFKRDGKYVLTPCNDQYRPPKPGEAYLHTNDTDAYITDKEGKRNDHFAKVYIPPYFRLRVSLFMVCLWVFSAFAGLCATLMPLCFGRQVLSMILPGNVLVNDIYAYSIGAYFFGGLIFCFMRSKSFFKAARDKALAATLRVWMQTVAKYSSQVLGCVYVHGFTRVILPTIFALLLQFYVIVPIATYVVISPGMGAQDAALTGAGNATVANLTGATLNSTTSSFSLGGNQTSSLYDKSYGIDSTILEHSIHAVSDYTLGTLYVNILLRFVTSSPTSRAAEAHRRILAPGHWNPDAILATRYFVLPATLLSIILLLGPVAGAECVIRAMELFSEKDVEGGLKLLMMRYSYPLSAVVVGAYLGARAVVNATKKWRNRIRDEVYLVGERLHNFGERRPPRGTRSVVRRG